MSRIGKESIIIPEQVRVRFFYGKKWNYLFVSGYYQEKVLKVPSYLMGYQRGQRIIFLMFSGARKDRKFWGFYKQVIKSYFETLEFGYKCSLELRGVGYKVLIKGSELIFSLGYSHKIIYKIPAQIFVKIIDSKNTCFDLFGYDRQFVAEVANQLQLLKRPEPYKGKGLLLKGEVIILKEGKKTES